MSVSIKCIHQEGWHGASGLQSTTWPASVLIWKLIETEVKTIRFHHVGCETGEIPSITNLALSCSDKHSPLSKRRPLAWNEWGPLGTTPHSLVYYRPPVFAIGFDTSLSNSSVPVCCWFVTLCIPTKVYQWEKGTRPGCEHGGISCPCLEVGTFNDCCTGVPGRDVRDCLLSTGRDSPRPTKRETFRDTNCGSYLKGRLTSLRSPGEGLGVWYPQFLQPCLGFQKKTWAVCQGSPSHWNVFSSALSLDHFCLKKS